jgi:DNA-binding protein HU-beta
MAERLNGDRSTAATAVNGVLAEIEGGVARGERVSLSGFGTFDRRQRAPRSGRNPRTGEPIHVSASVVPVFRAGAAFRAALTQAAGVSMASPSAAVDGGVTKAKGKKPQAAGSTSSVGAVAVATDAPGDADKKKSKKKGKKGSDPAEEKGSKKARKAAGKNKAGK